MKIGKKQILTQSYMFIREILSLIAMLIGLVPITLMAQEHDELSLNASQNIINNNLRLTSPDKLLRPENASILKAVKTVAKDYRNSQARIMLIAINDTETINSCIAGINSPVLNQRAAASMQLIAGANPRTIKLMIPDLFRDEDTVATRINDVKIVPPSVKAASIIRLIISNNDAFNNDVRSWASSLSAYPKILRSSMRTWWTLNKNAIESEDYGAVVGER